MRSGASRRGEDRISNGTKRRCDAPCVISCIAFPPSGIPHARFPQAQPHRHARLRERDPHSCARHPPQLRPVSAADEHGQRMGARGVRFRRGVAEPAVGRYAAFYRNARRPLRRRTRALRGRPVVRARPRLHGELDHRAGAHARDRHLRRHRHELHNFQYRVRRAGARVFRGEEERRARRRERCGLLGVGYFACGFQVVFIGTHFPAFLMDQGLTVRDGTISLALIGLFNIFGSYLAGQLGGRFSKTYLLSALYALRGVAIALLLAFPLTPMSAYLFAAAMGFLWLGTVPLTNGVVAGIFGVKHLAMLSGFVFFFHQLGSFFGGWLGGYLFDRTGSYQLVWLIAIGLSVISVVVNLPIDERPVARKPVPA